VTPLFGHLLSESSRRRRALHRLFKYSRDKDRPEARGLRLLRAWLSNEQRTQFDTFGYFDVTGSASGKTYRIHFGVSANIQELGSDGQPKTGWCFIPDGYLVPGDVMLAQKIALETSERDALAVANFFPSTIPALRREIRRPF
jgi:hypothetical protein